MPSEYVPERAIPHFAQPDVEERLVSALERLLARQPGQFRHQPHEMHAGHGGDEGVVFRHVADQAAHFARVVADIAAENARSSGRRLMEAEQRVEQRRFARAVRAQQADRSGPSATRSVC